MKVNSGFKGEGDGGIFENGNSSEGLSSECKGRGKGEGGEIYLNEDRQSGKN